MLGLGVWTAYCRITSLVKDRCLGKIYWIINKCEKYYFGF
jgi:hypothetical protein